MSGLRRPTLLLTGAAEGLGTSIAGTFAAAGYDVVGLARTERSSAQLSQRVEQGGGAYTHLICDVGQPIDVAAVLQPHAERIDVFVHNPHLLVRKPFEQTTADEFEQAWRVACLGAVTSAQLVLPYMVARGKGTIVLTGATAGLRGAAQFSAFASAKFALRGLAQSLAREFGPNGIHVAHVILDGLIDEPQTDRRFGPARSTRMNPDSVAAAYLGLASQHPSAWTQEMDLRPFAERF
ncbi:SDR family NAD(P)-dependent oxidoreductase [Bradyrhizobium sp.]|uniref:SDR family NAD(P)-dependent oxidoreductase n=1 Tax=Bradyrhizobium sp. TaxID=376 RepID=UPI0027254745|nr:SDR family NAD(P)-dependent oxidoreductase [Bradyrhizobium sp.]MDO9294435.1 SDR family NAD(P)-dependent oxidoreductase [Bradyrhizobium sp.]